MSKFLIKKIDLLERKVKENDQGVKREDVVIAIKLTSSGDTRTITDERLLRSVIDNFPEIK